MSSTSRQPPAAPATPPEPQKPPTKKKEAGKMSSPSGRQRMVTPDSPSSLQIQTSKALKTFNKLFSMIHPSKPGGGVPIQEEGQWNDKDHQPPGNLKR